ncbi:hypothetical protein [Streptomyces sp. NPDC052015]|uniref:hypothetical protein n=1 Tax=Streptomyces sp. NPDC052015 TaxID=3154755 RepID=UPI00341332FC
MTKQGRALMRWVTKPRLPDEGAAQGAGRRGPRTALRRVQQPQGIPGLGALAHHRQGAHPARTGPLARRLPGVRDHREGIAHLAAHHAAYAAAHPKLHLPDPSGGAGWPEEADRLLDGLRSECWSLAHAAETAAKKAQEERTRADSDFRAEFHRQAGQLALAMYREVFELKSAHAKALADTADEP